MSFEGWYQILCEEGHEYTCNCYDESNFETRKCSRCNKKMIWWNLVDITNGSYDNYISSKKERILKEKNIELIHTNSDGTKIWNIQINYEDEYWYGINNNGKEIKLWKANRIDGYVELKTKKKKKCKCCGNILEQTYEIPKGKGHLIKKEKDNGCFKKQSSGKR